MGHTLPRARHILSNSRYTEQALLEGMPECRGKTSVAYVGVADKFFHIQRTALPGQDKQLLSVCRLSEPRKNIEAVLHALGKLRGEFSFRYTIIGNGTDRPRLEALRNALGLDGMVSFAGFVTDDALQAAYASADLFILASSIIPHSHEGFGIVYLGSCGKWRAFACRPAGRGCRGCGRGRIGHVCR